MIEIGYITDSEDKTVSGSYASPVDANAAIMELRDALSSRDDIRTLFMQSDFGAGMNMYGFLDPLR